MKQRSKSVWLSLLVSLLLVFMLGGVVSAKSLYVLANHHARQFQAWNIPPAGPITYQGTFQLLYAYYPGGVAVHNQSKTLFITSESSNFEFVDATTFLSLGQLTGYQFAGVAVDEGNNIVYALQRYAYSGAKLNAYDFSRTGNTVTLTMRPGFPLTLPNYAGSTGMGITIDDTRSTPIIYIADSAAMMVRAYNTATWTEDPALSFSTASTGKGPIGIGIDRVRKIIYWGSMSFGAWVPPNAGSNQLYKYDQTTGVITQQATVSGQQVVDVSVDEATGIVYLTETAAMSVWDTSSMPWVQLQRETVGVDVDGSRDYFSSTCGLAVSNVSYMPSLTVEKTDDVADGSCRAPGDIISYSINFINAGNTALSGTTIVDTLPPEVDLEPGYLGIYDPAGHTLTVDIGDLAISQGGSVTVAVRVNPTAVAGTQITNYATIDSNETTATTVEGKTDICDIPQATCDVNADQFVDIDDIIMFGAFRGTTDANFDMDGDGVVTVLDARICVLQCDLPGCARPFLP